MEEKPDSAMGPLDEPGEANPIPAHEARGLGGLGTEGKTGNPSGGVEPQLPSDIPNPSEPEIKRIVRDIEQMPAEEGSPGVEKGGGQEDQNTELQ